ncbi:MAG: hypothetical protein J6Z74_01805, partial [Eubacterium sp.]|nr:hypothetical protein [Eubacterium sp.]
MRKNGRKCKCKSRRKRKGTIISLVLIMAMIAMCLQLPSMDTYAGAPGYIPNSGKDGKTEAPLNSEIVGPGGYEVLDGKSYSKIRFLYHHPIFKSYTEDTDSVVYYTDGFFDTSSENSDPRNYNRHIAPASMALAFSGMYLRKDEEADANGNIYYNKHAGVRQFFADMGCP